MIRQSGKFTLDSKLPAGGYREFLMNEAHYSRLTVSSPKAVTLFTASENAKEAVMSIYSVSLMYK